MGGRGDCGVGGVAEGGGRIIEWWEGLEGRSVDEDEEVGVRGVVGCGEVGEDGL